MAKFSNSMVAHIWANQSRPEAESNNGNFYFRGRRIYSYGSHFVAGTILPGVGPVVSADSYSITTAKHMGDVRRAVGWTAPDFPALTDIAGDLEAAAEARAAGRAPEAATLARLRGYAESTAARLDSDAGEVLGRLLGLRGGWAAFQSRTLAEAERKAEIAKRRNAKAAKARAKERAKALAWPVERARFLALWGDQWRRESNVKRSLSLLWEQCRDIPKAGETKADKAARAILWGRRKRLIAIAERLSGSVAAACRPEGRGKAISAIGRLRKLALGDWGGGDIPADPAAAFAAHYAGRASAWELIESILSDLSALHMPPATRARLVAAHTEAAGRFLSLRTLEDKRDNRRRENAGLRRTVANLRRLRETWRANGAQETLERMAEGGNLRAAIGAAGAVRAAWRDWGDYEGPRRFPGLSATLEALAVRLEAEAAPLRDSFEREAAERKAAEDRERARLAAMSPEEMRAAYRAGEVRRASLPYGIDSETGPLLRAVRPEVQGCRVTGGMLETSQGAEVPLRHAFRVFQFIAACRAAGRTWEPGGNWGPQAIRVGHFRVDSVAASGDFVAGCHSIKWAEVERLAARLGVADCMADPAEIAGELEGAA